jgi:hypothetical protein
MPTIRIPRLTLPTFRGSTSARQIKPNSPPAEPLVHPPQKARLDPVVSGRQNRVDLAVRTLSRAAVVAPIYHFRCFERSETIEAPAKATFLDQVFVMQGAPM